MEKTRILFIGTYFAPEPTGVGKYSGEMIDFLAAQGYECTVIVPYPYYPHWKIQAPYDKRSKWYSKELRQRPGCANITIYRCPQFVPKNPSGAKRMIQDLSFTTGALFRMFGELFKKKYDVVIAVAPSFMVGVLGLIYKKLRGAKLLYHIQDLQIDAARDLGMVKAGFLLNTLLRTEKYILRKADIVSSISPGMIKRIRNKYNRDVLFLPNWVDTKLFYPLIDKNQLKSEFGLNPFEKIVLYSGAIGEKQGLESIIYIAKEMQHVSDLKFVIGGSGPYKEKLVKISQELKLTNVVFLPLQPFDKLNKFLNMADVHLVLQKANASDLVMPSKLTTILSVGGVAIITATKESSLHELVESNQLGVLIEPENQDALLKAIESAVQHNPEKISGNARDYAEQFLSIEKVFSTLPAFR